MGPNINIEQKVADIVAKLPPIPDNIDRLIEMTLSGQYSEQDLITIIRNDPAVCTELLHFANEECFNYGKSVETIEEAIETISPDILAQIISVSFATDIIETNFTQMQYLDEYFQHSREISRTCHLLCEVTDCDTHTKQLYTTAGLIHDIGRLIILLASNKTTVSLMGTTWDEMVTIIDQEDNALGMNHCEVGMKLCKKWNFTPIMQEGVFRHHSPVLPNNISLAGGIIFLSHFISTSDFTGTILTKIIPSELLKELNLTEARWNRAKSLYFESIDPFE